jgi:hypothetical protein
MSVGYVAVCILIGLALGVALGWLERTWQTRHRLRHLPRGRR